MPAARSKPSSEERAADPGGDRRDVTGELAERHRLLVGLPGELVGRERARGTSSCRSTRGRTRGGAGRSFAWSCLLRGLGRSGEAGESSSGPRRLPHAARPSTRPPVPEPRDSALTSAGRRGPLSPGPELRQLVCDRRELLAVRTEDLQVRPDRLGLLLPRLPAHAGGLGLEARDLLVEELPGGVVGRRGAPVPEGGESLLEEGEDVRVQLRRERPPPRPR